MVIWLIGLSGAGKSTLGHEVAKQLRDVKPNTVLLDGDELRKVFAHDQGDDPYTVQGRRINAERIVALCEMLDSQGIHVVCCILSIFPDMRLENRKRFSRYFEVFMDAPIDVLMERDVKGIYAAARRGEVTNVVGIDIPYERPANPDMTIDTSKGGADIKQLASMVLEQAGLV
ncbi:MAG: adenylyl-sulfate kinase [Betaproteobacteria bacterium HGW-Betaproteobacteria-22]|nr:MAG: adenylyl-sulfate kinase [Betaproteobacteria bacterium HGW-Betaproteobacteria-22]